jgi:hypothetical protein
MYCAEQTWTDFIAWCLYNNINPNQEETLWLYMKTIDDEPIVAEEPDFEI